MHHINVNFKYHGEERFTVYPIGDMHIGNIGCDIPLYKEAIKEVENDPNGIVILMGDLAENILPNDKRFTLSEIHPLFINQTQTLPTAYLDFLVETLSPIKEKIIGIHRGNHEETLLKYYYRDICAELAGLLGTKYIPAQAFTKLSFEYTGGGGHKKSVIINSAHGHQSGRMTGGKVNFMENAAGWIDADLVLRGHSHSLFATKSLRMGVNPRNNKLIEKEVVVGHTGSFLSTYSSGATTYAEKSDYRPPAKGMMKIFIDVSLDKIKLSYQI